MSTQTRLDFEQPCILVARPPHDPGATKRLQRACLRLLELLGDGEPHSLGEMIRAGGSRFGARVLELRNAKYRVLGPMKSPRHDIWETEPMREGVECYRWAK